MGSMRAWICILAAAVVAAPALGQASGRRIAYQGRLTGVGAGPVDLTVRLFNVSTNGTELWEEVHDDVPLTHGAFSILLGDISGLGIPDSVFEEEPLWLELEVDAQVLSPRIRLGTVPTAVRAEAAHALTAPGTLDAAATVTAAGLIGFGTASPAGRLLLKCTNPMVNPHSGGFGIESYNSSKALWLYHHEDEFVFRSANQDVPVTFRGVSGEDTLTILSRSSQNGGGMIGIGASPIGRLHLKSADVSPGFTGGLGIESYNSDRALWIAHRQDEVVFRSTNWDVPIKFRGVGDQLALSIDPATKGLAVEGTTTTLGLTRFRTLRQGTPPSGDLRHSRRRTASKGHRPFYCMRIPITSMARVPG